MFNRIQSSNSSRSLFSVGSCLISLLLLAITFSSAAFGGEASLAADVSALPSDDELAVLQQTFHGFVAIAFPGDRVSQCVIRPASLFQRRRQDFHRAWFTLTYDAQCKGIEPVREEIWFLCTDRRGAIDCKLSLPPNPAH